MTRAFRLTCQSDLGRPKRPLYALKSVKFPINHSARAVQVIERLPRVVAVPTGAESIK